MKRVPEPELMDTAEQARAYAEADFQETDDALFASIVDGLPQPPKRVLDLGCGPGNLALRFARRFPEATVVGADGSAAMLAHGIRAASAEGLHVRFVEALVQDLPLDAPFDLIVSNSLLHHLHDPTVLWTAVQRWGEPGARFVVADLRRPPSIEVLHAISEEYGADQEPVLRRDFEASLAAAFEPQEVHAQLAPFGFADVAVFEPTDRHLRVEGRLPA